LPAIPERLRLALAADGRERAATDTASVDRGDIELAWTEYEYEADDTKTGEKPSTSALATWSTSSVRVPTAGQAPGTPLRTGDPVGGR
jgi:hypothetical protein